MQNMFATKCRIYNKVVVWNVMDFKVNHNI